MRRKETAWKKSRKFGDIYGGRERLKLEDNIFKRAHSLKLPSPNDELPILIEDNPSRDYFFPLDVYEAKEAISALPKRDYSGITHLWLRRFKSSDQKGPYRPLAEFICGSGVRVIVLYPWPRTMIQDFGKNKPAPKTVREIGKYNVSVTKRGDNWSAKWTLPQLRKYYIQTLLFHEVGHHVDWYYRHWSKANVRKTEEVADQYAISKSTTATYVFNRLQKQSDMST